MAKCLVIVEEEDETGLYVAKVYPHEMRRGPLDRAIAACQDVVGDGTVVHVEFVPHDQAELVRAVWSAAHRNYRSTEHEWISRKGAIRILMRLGINHNAARRMLREAKLGAQPSCYGLVYDRDRFRKFRNQVAASIETGADEER